MTTELSVPILGEILEHSSVAITVADADGRLTVFNRAAEALTGYRRDEVLGQPVAMFYRDETELSDMWAVVARDGKLENHETMLRVRDGSLRPASVLVTALQDGAGHVVGSLAITVDLSERRRLQAEIDEARRRAEFYNDLLCHDIRNFDQTILGYLELVLGDKLGPVSEQQRRVLSICRRQAQRMRELIDRVLALARLQAGPVAPLVTLAVGPLAHGAARTVRTSYRDRTPEVSLDVPESCLVVAGLQLEEALANLLANGVVHNPAATPWVRLAAKRGGRDDAPVWRLEVEDHGPGVPDDRKPELFERFARMSPRGSGVGLSLVKAIVEAYGGRVWVEDRVSGQPEEGARFVVELPAGIA
jgi:PAS domain S-box-containing protein